MAAIQDHHVVDIYEQDADLVRRVSGYLADGLARGETVVVIATPDHRALIAEALSGHDADVRGCRSGGTLIERDAETLLSGFYPEGELDPARFDATVGALFRAGRRSPGIRVVGEMVDLLWRGGDVVGALSVESEWNDLATRHDFTLYCCYRSDGVHVDEDALARVQELHGAVVSAPAAISWIGCRSSTSLPPAAASPRVARHFVAEALRRWGLDAYVDAASMIVAELSTNAVLHAGTPFEVAVSRRSAALRIAVRDASRFVPILRQPSSTEPGGRGLPIVASLAREWAIDPEPSGKTVWADLPIAPR